MLWFDCCSTWNTWPQEWLKPGMLHWEKFSPTSRFDPVRSELAEMDACSPSGPLTLRLENRVISARFISGKRFRSLS